MLVLAHRRNSSKSLIDDSSVNVSLASTCEVLLPKNPDEFIKGSNSVKTSVSSNAIKDSAVSTHDDQDTSESYRQRELRKL